MKSRSAQWVSPRQSQQGPATLIHVMSKLVHNGHSSSAPPLLSSLSAIRPPIQPVRTSHSSGQDTRDPDYRFGMSTLRLLAILTLLAGLDVAATVAIKQAVVKAEPMYMIAGIFAMIAVAGVLALAIDKTELTVVALGWIILFQVLIVAVDRFMYGVRPGPVETIALVVALIALTVAMLAPKGESTPRIRASQAKHVARPMIPAPRGPVQQIIASRAHVQAGKAVQRNHDERVQQDYWGGASTLRMKL